MRMRAKYVDIRIASASGVADRWASQYRDQDGKWRFPPICVQKGRTSSDVYDDLCELGGNPPIDKVAEIIGNKSWSYISCDGCSEYVERAVGIGEFEPKAYCATCINEAAYALKGET